MFVPSLKWYERLYRFLTPWKNAERERRAKAVLRFLLEHPYEPVRFEP